ncbi:MAG TPA: hypothetical protein VHD14_05850 [Pseudolabrys sp.]|nr:hypothetical protein [Pseudolabrys sp.]
MSTQKSQKDIERANAAFQKKELQARDGAVATAEYNAAIQAERDKTAKLRALRLAKEAADREAAKSAPVKAKSKAGKKKK